MCGKETKAGNQKQKIKRMEKEKMERGVRLERHRRRAGRILGRRDRGQPEAKWHIRTEWSPKGLHGFKHNQPTVTELSHCFFYWDFSTT